MIGKVVQGLEFHFCDEDVTHVPSEVLKLSEETDLDVLNHTMEVIVEQFHNELLPVATQLTTRLVCRCCSLSITYLTFSQCQTYHRLLQEANAASDATEVLIAAEDKLPDDDKTFAAMGVAKTLGTVSNSYRRICGFGCLPSLDHLFRGILARDLEEIQQIIIPHIAFTLSSKAIGN